MAFRSAGAATSVASSATSATAGAPAGFVADDILILILSSDANASTPSPPSGFTQLTKDTFTTPDGQVIVIWWKRAVGSDSLTVTGMSNVASKLLRCFAWSGRDTTNPPVMSASAVNQSSNASPTTLTANGVTALTGDDLFWFGGLDVNTSGAPTFTQPTGYTTQGVSTDTVDGFDIFGAATKDNVSAGATGTVSGTLTHSGSAGWNAYVIRIPAASIGTTYDMSSALAAFVDYSLRGSGLDSSVSGGFEKSAFENTAFYVALGTTYSNSIALAITAVLSDNYALSMFQNATLTITTADVVTDQLNAVATVSLPAAVSASIVGNYIASMALPALSITTAQTTAKTLGISVANTLATTTALAILGGQNVAAAITAALSTSMTDSASVTISGLANYAVTLNAVVTALLNVNGSASFAASLLETSSAVLNAVASEQFALTMSEIVSGSLNINAVEALATSLQYATLAGFTFSGSVTMPASLAYALASSFAYLVTAPLSITTAYSASTLKTAAGLVTLGITTGYALAYQLSLVASAQLSVTTNETANTAGSVYGVSIPLQLHAQVSDAAQNVMTALTSMGIHPTLATQAVNIIVQAIALGIATGLSDDSTKNALQIAALIAEAILVVQQLTANTVEVDQKLTAESVANVEQLAADLVQNVQRLTAESITDIT
jgi:hypothetical protein